MALTPRTHSIGPGRPRAMCAASPGGSNRAIGGVARLFQLLASHLGLVPPDRSGGHEHVVLVPLARQEDRVPWLREADGVGDRRAAVADDPQVVVVTRPGLARAVRDL